MGANAARCATTFFNVTLIELMEISRIFHNKKIIRFLRARIYCDNDEYDKFLLCSHGVSAWERNAGSFTRAKLIIEIVITNRNVHICFGSLDDNEILYETFSD